VEASIQWLTIALAALDVLLVPAAVGVIRALWQLDRRLARLENILETKGLVHGT
jgi:putative effector of murein hydrolase LrgA (UPF0299 family)